MKQFANIISYLFIPPVNLLLIFIFMSLKIYDDPELQIKTISLAAILGFAIPIMVFVFFRLKSEIVDNDASIRSERTKPYIIGVALSILGAMLSMLFELHPFIVALWLSYFVCSSILVIVNNYLKISAHAIGIAIPFAVLVFIFGNYGYYFFILVFAISWARVYQKLHTLTQVLAGLSIGIFVTFLILNWSLRLV